jgi:hypothetical protein
MSRFESFEMLRPAALDGRREEKRNLSVLSDSDRDQILVPGPRGRIFTARLAPDKVYFYFEGHVELDMFETSMPIANEVLKSGAAKLYGDGENWKTYAVGYRNAWTSWFIKNRKVVTRTRLVVNSPLLRMCVQVVNLFASNPIESLAKSGELYRIIDEEIPGVRDLAKAWPKEIAARLVRR